MVSPTSEDKPADTVAPEQPASPRGLGFGFDPGFGRAGVGVSFG
jgi:hypothetical protein